MEPRDSLEIQLLSGEIHTTPLKTIFDIVYPFGDFLGFAISITLSGLSLKFPGSKYKFNIISILLGLAVMTIGDAVFSYTTTVGTFYNGQFGDLLLTTGLFLLTFGVLGFYQAKTLNTNSNNTPD